MRINSKLRVIFFSILILAVGSSYVNAVGTYPAVSQDMLLYYHFGNQSAYGEDDTKVYDFSGNGNNGTIVEPLTFKPTGGILNGGAYYYPKSGFVNLSDKTAYSLNTTGGMTFSYWFKINGSITDANHYIFAKGKAYNYEYDMYTMTSRRLTFTIYRPNGASWNEVYTPISYLTADKWYYVTVTFNITTGLKMYINGDYIASNANAWSTTYKLADTTNSNSSLVIGKRTWSGTPFNGTIDEFIMYDRTLTADEVKANYKTYIPCIVPASGTVLGSYDKITLCNGTYYINSSSVFTLAGSYINITGNDTTIIGNGTGNLFVTQWTTSGFDNLTIDNVIGSKYSYGVYFSDTRKPRILNSNFYNMSSSGISLFETNNSIVRNNKLVNCSNAIVVATKSYDNLVDNNEVYGGKFALYATSKVIRTTFSNNYIYNTTNTYSSVVINDNSNYTRVINNTINYAGWNGIDSESFYNTLANNTINNSYHHGIDYVNPSTGTTVTSGNDVIDNNKIYNTIYSAIYIRKAFKTNVTNNYIDRVVNTTFDCAGIANEGYTTYNYDNYFYNNTIIDTCTPIYSSTNSTWYKNHIYGTTDVDIRSLSSLDVKPTTVRYLSNDFNSTLIKIYGTSSTTNLFYYSNGKTFLINSSHSSGGKAYYLYNMTKPLIYFSNKTGLISKSQANLTLQPNNYAYILENFNLTEGVTRQYSPITLSASSSSQKKVTSLLTSPVTITGIFDVDECNVAVNYESSLGTYKTTSDFSCDTTTLQATTTFTVEPGINTLDIVAVGGGSGGSISTKKKVLTATNITNKTGTNLQKTNTTPTKINITEKKSFSYLKYAVIGLVCIVLILIGWRIILQVLLGLGKLLLMLGTQMGKVLLALLLFAGKAVLGIFKIFGSNIVGIIFIIGLIFIGSIYLISKYLV